MTKRQQQQNLSQSRDGGYTIIESLVAMIVVSVLMIAIAPVMAYSVATRVQARRMELATQAAKAYINALRTGAIRPAGSIPASPPGFPTSDPAVPPATPAAPTDLNVLYCVNLDDKPGCAGSQEFLVQGVRRPNTGTTLPTDTGYALTVRVYRADATVGTMTKEQQSVANSALGNPQAPLVVMKTEIPPTTRGGASAYRSLCSRLPGANSCQ
ncbi:MAG: type II secretion system protein [Microcoleus sp. PH2017_40_RAT_O_B]|uniref:hormogonium polysaccharide secretion pseudopilin HpsB n=1 Tax=unclassified Microcoleus TaxID=2642155 RepID=UPI001D604181|nr:MULTISPECIES: hormogonium polysaccharide secretion pseudopilin HpsB [unclassified Microcoleus]MCC3453463.1 type II secretion system protein [Microcoleus sp. PH2017_08_TRC_O_A]MCC3566460.1 type II secretion system protein [Microcoleus sp. PH2017_31_RDM_U_A]MCC3571701.1 type II secretion system protein [Microcoleus sp. PH2017_34_RAT_O_A]MCC3578863.1 type II secretion system protein [Microcoleus sp. PH2017_32_RDM_D_A]MCC3611909.1 type II secretion system protein [Microcoleus sp. PH2017_40_RAT_